MLYDNKNRDALVSGRSLANRPQISPDWVSILLAPVQIGPLERTLVMAMLGQLAQCCACTAVCRRRDEPGGVDSLGGGRHAGGWCKGWLKALHESSPLLPQDGSGCLNANLQRGRCCGPGHGRCRRRQDDCPPTEVQVNMDGLGSRRCSVDGADIGCG
jgi:hypothetical protein